MFNEDCEDCMVGYKCVGAILIIDTFEEMFNREKTLEKVFNYCLKGGGQEIINDFELCAEKFNSIKEYIKNIPKDLKPLFAKNIDSLEFQKFIK